MRDVLLNETLYLSMAHARVEIAAWVEVFNRERPHSSLGHAKPAAFAVELDKQCPASPHPTGFAKQPIASTALMRKTTARLQSQLGYAGGHVNEHFHVAQCTNGEFFSDGAHVFPNWNAGFAAEDR
jgi:hypothetical protein